MFKSTAYLCKIVIIIKRHYLSNEQLTMLDNTFYNLLIVEQLAKGES